MPTRSRTIQTIAENLEFLTYYQPLDQALEALTHRQHALAFTTRIQLPIVNIEEVNQFLNRSNEFIKFTLCCIYTCLIIDPSYRPSFATLIILGYNLQYVCTLPKCPICDLPHGLWCNTRFNIELPLHPIPEDTENA